MLVNALGVAQVISWGTLFYAIGVLGAPMRAELDVSELFLFGAFTAGLVTSALLATQSGRMVDRLGGRVVLSSGSLLGGAAMALLALAPNGAVMAAGWVVAGAAMSACLYDPAFATLSQHAGDNYRRWVAYLTLWGGFASTVFWPVSKWLLDAVGWRNAFLTYAALHLLVCLPIHLRVVPRIARKVPAPAPVSAEPIALASHHARLRWLTASLALATFVVGVMAVHVIALLTGGGLTLDQAVLISTLFGPIQVAGRVLEMTFARHVSAVRMGFVPFGLLLAAVVTLVAVDGFGVMAFAFIFAYGVGNGILTIMRGTVPAELFGSQGLGATLGHLSRATLFARAIAPASFAALLAAGLTRTQALWSLAAIVVAAGLCYAVTVKGHRT